jgi:hypothetical protein
MPASWSTCCAFSIFSQASDVSAVRLTLDSNSRWINQIYLVARQEMEHLAIALNLLSIVGGEPHFDRPNFPIPKNRSLLDLPLCLERFGKNSLLRFIWYERPSYLTPKKPATNCFEKIDFDDTVGDQPHEKCGGLQIETLQALYEQIQIAFQNLDPREIFVGDPDRQFGKTFGYSIDMLTVQSVDDAVKAVGRILEQGEGIGANPANSDPHFARFTSILDELTELTERSSLKDLILEPALPVVANPSTRQNKFNFPVSLITDEKTVEVMHLFNDCYALLLVMLKSFFATQYNNFDPTPRCSSAMFYAAFFPMMTMVIRPIGEIICRLPAGDKFHGQNAGPSFELFEQPVKIQIEREWYVKQLQDLAARAIHTAHHSIDDSDLQQRMKYIYESLTSMRLHLDHIWQHGN